jgi:hypothetical protein
MHEDRSRGDSTPASSNADEDYKWQGRVLGFVLHEYPHQLTEKEIVREMVGEKPSFDQRDAVERAIEEVVRAGLFRRCESMVLLTKAGIQLISIEID